MFNFMCRIQLEILDIGSAIRFDFLQQIEFSCLQIKFVDD